MLFPSLSACMVYVLNGQSQVFGVGELEEVADGDNGGLAREEGLGNLLVVVSIPIILS